MSTPFLWSILLKLVEPLGNVLQMDAMESLLPHMNARMLIAFELRNELLDDIKIELQDEILTCPIKYMGGMNSYLIYKREGHLRRNCPIFKKKPPKIVNLNDQSNPNPLIPTNCDPTSISTSLVGESCPDPSKDSDDSFPAPSLMDKIKVFVLKLGKQAYPLLSLHPL